MNFYESLGDGPIHRLPPAIKLIALFGLSVVLFMLNTPLALGILTALVALSSLAFCRSAVVQWLKSWPLLLTIAVVVVWTAYANSFEAASIVLMRLGSLSLFATVITATTTIGQFIDTITRAARPFEAIGIGNARDIGLAIGLVIRFVPEVHAHYKSVAEAHRARGLKMRLSTVIVPMVIGTMQSADEIANAIDARCIRSQQRKHN
ncbi:MULTISPECIES: energy-coupling factor transporter transmembrane component T family protein [Brucella/Ochrobactrum group]|jgi:biotin transport system permease protein|uniref:energy-coupling factor transporter transmembrane component T family protein n=1 Tax=Brucella/Ochrobactrum group TaxID=2826938 RepID=UPI001C056242|nr:energy-coupling factor transporter transmembrane protein EcfT [Brucella sp. NBRC 12950]QWK79941.1 energy-coupling factor transporter transmembrane protein EcfT [Ochrobactrum sp. BTU1]GLU27184.1 transporter [Brucella sp. NBRC 12950]